MRVLHRRHVLFCLGGALALLPPRTVSAHLRLVRSEPTAGAALNAPPKLLRLVFSVPPELALSKVVLLSAAGDTIAITPVAADSTEKTILFVVPRAPLSIGSYRIVWRTASADAHPITGDIAFTVIGTPSDMDHVHEPVDLASPRPVSTTDVPTTPGGPTVPMATTLTRTAGFAALFTLVGAVCFRFLVVGRLWRWQNGKREAGAIYRAHQIALGACGVYFVSHFARLTLEGSALLEGEPLTSARAVDIIANTAWGLSWVVGFAGLVIALVGMTGTGGRPRLGWAAATLGSLLLALAAAMSGHAASATNVPFAVGLVAIHVLAAAAWLGTLLLVVFAGMPAAMFDGRGDSPHTGIAELVAAFNPVALTAATIAFLSGAGTSLRYLRSLEELTGTAYGRTLMLKLAVVGSAAVLGFINWRIVSRRLGTSAGTRLVRRSAKLELMFGALVLVVSAILVVMPLPRP